MDSKARGVYILAFRLVYKYRLECENTNESIENSKLLSVTVCKLRLKEF